MTKIKTINWSIQNSSLIFPFLFFVFYYFNIYFHTKINIPDLCCHFVLALFIFTFLFDTQIWNAGYTYVKIAQIWKHYGWIWIQIEDFLFERWNLMFHTMINSHNLSTWKLFFFHENHCGWLPVMALLIGQSVILGLPNTKTKINKLETHFLSLLIETNELQTHINKYNNNVFSDFVFCGDDSPKLVK